MEKKFTVKQIMEMMAHEIARLQKLCKDNGIDPKPPNTTPGASMSLTASVKVFKTTEEAEDALAKSKEL